MCCTCFCCVCDWDVVCVRCVFTPCGESVGVGFAMAGVDADAAAGEGMGGGGGGRADPLAELPELELLVGVADMFEERGDGEKFFSVKFDRIFPGFSGFVPLARAREFFNGEIYAMLCIAYISRRANAFAFASVDSFSFSCGGGMCVFWWEN